MTELFRALLEEHAERGLGGLLAGWWIGLRDLARPLPEGPGAASDRAWEGGMERFGGAGTRGISEDAVFAWRSLRRDLRFTTLLVGVLGVGVALNTAVFSVVNAYLVRPLPYPAAERIVDVRPVTDLTWTQVGDYFERAVSWDLDVFTLVGEEGPQMVRGSWITPDFLDVYGVRAAMGRTFLPQEADPGAAPVAMISHRLWRERFHGDPAIVGRTFDAFTSDRPDHAESFRIVGVLPRDFWHVNDFTEVFAPIRVERAVYVGRLRPDMPLALAEAGLTELARSTTAGLPPDFRITLTPLQEAYTRSVRPVLTVLQGAVGLVLLIACANAIVLLLVRSARRARELGVRRALGATATRLGRQLALEGLLLSTTAGGVGLALASLLLGSTRAGLQARLGRSIPGGLEAVQLDGTVVLVTAAACLAMGLAFGLVPAWLLTGRGTFSALWNSSSRGGSEPAGRRRMRSAMVGAEVALSTALLAGAALMVRSAVHLQRMDIGFDAARVVPGSIGLRHASYPDPEQRVALFERMLAGTRALPGVQAAALVSSTPFSGIVRPDPVEAETSDGSDARAEATVAAAGDGVFDALGIGVLQGRDFGSGDVAGAEPVAIVSRGLAERLWPGRDPLGRRIRVAVDERTATMMGREPGAWHTVVGVVGDITRDLSFASDGQVWMSYRQEAGFWMTLLTRYRPGVGASSVTGSVTTLLAELDPDLPYTVGSDLSEMVSAARAPTQFVAWLLAGFSAFALALALVGLYGVIAYAARQRRRDLAIRMALGADAGSVIALFVRQGMTVVAGGVLVGALGGLVVARALAGQLRGVAPDDPLTHGSVAVGLLLTAALAVWIPARQASRAAPMGALREE